MLYIYLVLLFYLFIQPVHYRFLKRSTFGSTFFRAYTVRVSNGKSVRSPDINGLRTHAISRIDLSVLIRWGTKRPKREPKSSSYTRLPLIGRQMLHDACVATRGVTIHSDHETRRDTILGSLERDEICFIVTLYMHEI